MGRGAASGAPECPAGAGDFGRHAWPTLGLACGMLALHVAAVALAARGAWALGGLVGAAAAWTAFTCLHEASHGTVSRARALNALVGELGAHVLGVRFLGFRQLHQRHHRHTNDVTLDPDAYVGRGPRALRPLRLATTDLHYYVAYDRRALRASRSEAWLSNASVAALLGLGAAVAYTLGPAALVLGWLVPARVALFAAAYVADALPHGRPSAPSREQSPLGHTRAVEGGRAFDWLALGQAQHLLHHLWPRVPFYRLPALWRRERGQLVARGVDVVDPLGRPLRVVPSVEGPGLAVCATR